MKSMTQPEHPQKSANTKFVILIIASVLWISCKPSGNEGETGSAWEQAGAKAEDNTGTLQAKPEQESTIKLDLAEGELHKWMAREIKKLDAPDPLPDSPNFRLLHERLFVFTRCAGLLRQAEATADTATASLARQLEDKVTQRQQQEYPLLRKRLAGIFTKELAANHIVVKLKGDRNEEMCFIAREFARSNYIENFRINLSTAIREFRFKKISYRAQLNGAIISSYIPTARPDTEISEYLE